MTGACRVDALLLDCDGVVRRFDPAVEAAIDARYGLPARTLHAAVLSPARIGALVSGSLTWAERLAEVAAELPLAPEAARAAVAEWGAYRGEPVPEVVAFMAEARAAGPHRPSARKYRGERRRSTVRTCLRTGCWSPICGSSTADLVASKRTAGSGLQHGRDMPTTVAAPRSAPPRVFAATVGGRGVADPAGSCADPRGSCDDGLRTVVLLPFQGWR